MRKGLQLKRMVRVAIASAALSGTLLVSGCGHADVAATFDGHTVTEAQVIDYCKAHMAHFKVPKAVVFVEALPKNPSGKIMKRELRTRFEGMLKQA